MQPIQHNQGQAPQITHYMHVETEKMLLNVEGLSKVILGQPIPEQQASHTTFQKSPSFLQVLGSIPSIDLSTRQYNILSSTTNVTYQGNQSQQARREDQERNNAILAGVVAVAGIIGVGFLLGGSIAESEEAGRKDGKLSAQVKKWDANKYAYAQRPQYKDKVEETVDLAQQIVQDINRSKKIDVVINVALLAGFVLLGIGAFYASYNAAIIILAIAAAAKMIKVSYEWFSTNRQEKAKEIQENMKWFRNPSEGSFIPFEHMQNFILPNLAQPFSFHPGNADAIRA